MGRGESNLGISEVLTIVFVILKLTHVVDWSWWWVLSPFWIPILIIFLLDLWHRLND